MDKEEAMSGLRQIVSTCPTHGANLMLIRLLICNAQFGKALDVASGPVGSKVDEVWFAFYKSDRELAVLAADEGDDLLIELIYE